MESKSRFLVFLKRLLLITVTFVAVVIFIYGCSAVRTLNRYEYNLNADIGSVYKTEDKMTTLTIISEKEAELVNENASLIYTVSIKDNIIFLDGQESRNVFIALSSTELLWQTKNSYMFKEIEGHIDEEVWG